MPGIVFLCLLIASAAKPMRPPPTKIWTCSLASTVCFGSETTRPKHEQFFHGSPIPLWLADQLGKSSPGFSNSRLQLRVRVLPQIDEATVVCHSLGHAASCIIQLTQSEERSRQLERENVDLSARSTYEECSETTRSWVSLGGMNA